MAAQPQDPAIDPRRARSFGAVAQAYARHRPRYPAEAVDLASAGPAQPSRRVLDLGAGTGVLTGQLAARGVNVVAVEPDPEMLAQLRADLPEVDDRQGSAERVPLPDASVDAILVGQALHWFDLERATPLMARVLRPGGVLAALWNGVDRDAGWPHELGEVAGRGRTAPSNPRGAGHAVTMPGPPWFGSPAGGTSIGAERSAGGTSIGAERSAGGTSICAERTEIRWTRPLTVESYLADVATHSWALTSEPADREAAFARIRAYLADRPETASGEFDMPMVTLVWRTFRR